MSAATMPTKMAATHSIAPMKRSMRLRVMTWTSGVFPSPSSGRVQRDVSLAERGGDYGHGLLLWGAPTRRLRRLPPRRRGGRTALRAHPGRPASVPRVILRKLVLEFLHRDNRIYADLADVVGPGLLQRLGGLLPLRELRFGKRIDVVTRLRFDLGNAFMLELAPRAADLAGKVGGAIVVDRLFLRWRHLVVFVFVEHEREGGDIERHIHVELRHLVDAEQHQRAPREGHRISDALFQYVAHFGRARLNIDAAQLAHEGSHGGVRGSDLQAPDVARHQDLLVGMERARIVDKGETEFHVLHLAGGIFAVPGIERLGSALGIGHQERKLARRNDGEAPRLVAGIHIGEVGYAVAGHIVMVERFAELLGRKHLVFEGSAGRLLDRGPPVLQRFLQRMIWRYPVG